jgi:hypothetical protein
MLAPIATIFRLASPDRTTSACLARPFSLYAGEYLVDVKFGVMNSRR